MVAGRLAGAFRNVGRDKVADDVLTGMKAVGYKVTEADPFEEVSTLRFDTRERSPYVTRMRLIRQSMHVPPPREAVLDLMPVFFDLLRKEEHAAVRVVLGYFMFVYIHPYMDGNGRMGRFLMNVMMASGGYPWTVIRVDQRGHYMTALEKASVHRNIEPFARFLGGLL